MGWDEIYREKGVLQTEPKRFFTENVPKFRNAEGRALDMGCGTGRHLPLLIEHFGEVHGCDVSPTALELVKPDIMAKARLRVSYFSALNYPSGHFDFVMSSSALHHGTAAEVRKGIAEMRRVMKRGGVAVIDLITEPEGMFADADEIEPNTIVPKSGMEKGVAHHFFTEEEAREFLSEFEILHMQQASYEKELAHADGPGGRVRRLEIIARKK